RTPLAAARLRLQTALDHDLRRDDVVAALGALHTLSHRTEKLLQLSRAESGASFTRERIDLAQLAATVAQDFWQDPAVIDRLGLKVPDSGDAPVALGDFDAIAIALRNLVENALRYAQGAAVEIEVDADGRLIVRDFGPGVTEVELRTLQLRHVRHSAERAGYGLGMSIVATIVQKHDAQLELLSPPPGAAHGFEARIVLPPAQGQR
ncbi:MAG: HAMP domain-containing sensor histidine kinase, partial [Variovorax sp.]